MPPGRAPLLATLLAACLGCGDAAPEPAAASGSAPEPDAVAVRVEGLALDPESDSPIVILVDAEGGRRLPIWIGPTEARAIALELEEKTPPRPNTHDLARRLIEGLDGRIERIVVTDLRDGIYFARIDLDQDGRHVSVDARPSDAIAIGLRLDAPLFVRAELFERGGLGEESPGRPIRGVAEERQVRGLSL